jgi:CRP-like cAMP-binding protein
MNSTRRDSVKETFLRFLMKHLTLSEKKKKFILTLPMFKTFPKGSLLFKKGDLTEANYLVIKGGIRTYLIVEGDDITTAFYTETQAFLPSSTIVKTPSTCYATCFEDSVLVVCTEDVEKKVFQYVPELAFICRKFSEKLLAKIQQSLDMYKSLTPEQRYLHLISERPELLQRVPQYQLASYLGIRPESLSRIRKRLVKKDFRSS